MKKSPRKCRSQAACKVLQGKSRFVIVAVDFAKSTMKVQAYLDRETVGWRRGLDVDNTQAGLSFLLEKLEGLCRKWQVDRKDLLFGGEDPGPYALPFIESLRRRGFLFVAVTAKAASRNRDNSRASSDLLDLDGIAETMRQGIVRDIESSESVYSELKRACRARQQALESETQAENQIRRLVDLAFPGLLDDKRSGLVPMGSACLALLASGATPAKVLGMKDASLVQLLRRSGAYRPKAAAAAVRKAAEQALEATPDPARIMEVLRHKIATLRSLRAEIACEELQMAHLLAQTPGVWLLTIPGVGVILAASFVGELGDPVRWRSVDQIYSYAGCAQRQKQTGGPDKAPYSLGLPRDCNHRLKDALMQLSHHVGVALHPAAKAVGEDGDHRLRRHFREVEARGGNSLLSTARLLLRIAVPMVRDGRPYLQWDEDAEGVPGETLAAWMDATIAAAIAKFPKGSLKGIPKGASRIDDLQEFAKAYARTAKGLHRL